MTPFPPPHTPLAGSRLALPLSTSSAFCFRHEYKQTLFSLVLSSIVLLVRSRLSQPQQQQQLNLAAKRLLTVFFLIRYVLSFADRSLSLLMLDDD
jgi:hypothetical protein